MSDGRTRTDVETTEITATYAVENLAFEVANLALLANVIVPGALSLMSGFAFVDNKQVSRTRAFLTEDWYRAHDANRKYSWPAFLSLGIEDAWQWLQETKAIDSGIARGPAGRALAALSYTTSETTESDSSMNLAWILLGLESLYCTGNVGLREQLVAKTELVLGPRSDNKKAFGAMYDFRSRLLHGDMDLPLRFTPFNAVPAFERHYDDLGDYEGVGLAALIATIQHMIKHRWKALSFRHTLQGVPIAPVS